VTLILDLDLHILKMYRHTKNEISVSLLCNLRAQIGQTDTQTDGTENMTTPHSRLVKLACQYGWFVAFHWLYFSEDYYHDALNVHRGCC